MPRAGTHIRPPPARAVPPDLSAGRCQPGNSALPPDAWAEPATRAEREAARNLCRTCPVLEPCRDWTLTLPLSGAAGVLGGMTVTEREQARRGTLPAEPQPEPDPRLAPLAGTTVPPWVRYGTPGPAVTAHAGLATAAGTAPGAIAGQPCQCGCGTLIPVQPGRRYLDEAHQHRAWRARQRRYEERTCACGCGLAVPDDPRHPGRKFAGEACRRRQQAADERAALAAFRAAAVPAVPVREPVRGPAVVPAFTSLATVGAPGR